MSNLIKDLYNNKLSQYGKNDYRSLNWGDKEGTSARARYEQMFNQYDWSDKSVFEVGCGWGSFFDFGYTCDYYWGIDINEKFIEIANEKFTNTATTNYPKPIFEVKDILKCYYDKKYDVAISTGGAGNRGGPAWHPQMLHKFLTKIYNISKVSLINFPSTWATIRTETVEYFSPEQILSQALQITQNVELIHKEKSDLLLILKHE